MHCRTCILYLLLWTLPFVTSSVWQIKDTNTMKETESMVYLRCKTIPCRHDDISFSVWHILPTFLLSLLIYFSLFPSSYPSITNISNRSSSRRPKRLYASGFDCCVLVSMVFKGRCKNYTSCREWMMRRGEKRERYKKKRYTEFFDLSEMCPIVETNSACARGCWYHIPSYYFLLSFFLFSFFFFLFSLLFFSFSSFSFLLYRPLFSWLPQICKR